jgi:hypothetical protein
MTKEQQKERDEITKDQLASFKRVAREIGVGEKELHQAILWAIANDVKEPRML